MFGCSAMEFQNMFVYRLFQFQASFNSFQGTFPIKELIYSKVHWPSYLFDHLFSGDWAGHAPSLGYDLLDGSNTVSYTHLTLPTTPYV